MRAVVYDEDPLLRASRAGHWPLILAAVVLRTRRMGFEGFRSFVDIRAWVRRLT